MIGSTEAITVYQKNINPITLDHEEAYLLDFILERSCIFFDSFTEDDLFLFGDVPKLGHEVHNLQKKFESLVSQGLLLQCSVVDSKTPYFVPLELYLAYRAMREKDEHNALQELQDILEIEKPLPEHLLRYTRAFNGRYDEANKILYNSMSYEQEQPPLNYKKVAEIFHTTYIASETKMELTRPIRGINPEDR